jgi:thiosulfate reductase cytochrome b subunit
MPQVTALYNPLQKSAYLVVTMTLAAVFVTGAMLALPVQFSPLLRGAAAWQTVRIAHFACLCVFAAFVPGHLLMVALTGRSAMSQMLVGHSGDALNTTRLADPR